MKRILALMLVLGMASFANAALLISVDGVINPPGTWIVPSPSDHAVIDIWGDGQSPAPQFMYLASSSSTCDAILDSTNLTFKWIGPLSAFYQVTDPDELDYISYLIGGGPVCSAIFIALADGGAPPQPPLEGVLVDGIDLHCAGSIDDGVLYLVDYEGREIFDTQVFQTPEPASILLLGLGGLALLRKKRCSRL